MPKLTSLKAIRKHCLWCMNNNSQAVRECIGKKLCPLYPLRLGYTVKGQPACKLIRAMCRQCVETPNDIRKCTGIMLNGFCPIWSYRFGAYPKKGEPAHKLTLNFKNLDPTHTKGHENVHDRFQEAIR